MFAQLEEALRRADEDYLTGLSNRGTVNRARKDLSSLTPEIREEGSGAVVVALGGEDCAIRVPLGESTCTCPAPGMCRHRMAAILWLKERLGESGAPEEAEKPDLTPLLEVPVDRFRRAMGARAFHDSVFRLGREGLPPISESSVVQVELWDAVVKLLLPLEHAACTCRSRELCRHKAEALLAYQILKKRHTLEELADHAAQKEDRWDLEQVSAAACSVRELTAGLLETGISRLSPAAPDSAERLAALCHAAGLPRLESGLRALSGLLGQALERSAAFRTGDLLLRLARLEHLARQLERLPEPARLPELAGTFRETYAACPELTLTLLGERKLRTDSGYEGVVYYFWELSERRWYTYTTARPVFYDRRSRRNPAYQGAPWGLERRMDQLYGMTLTLERAKAARGRRLSSSEESRASVGRKLSPWAAGVTCWTDFAALFQALEPHLPDGPETERTAMIRPARCVPREFDRTAQRFCLTLLDRKGRDLNLEVAYRAHEQDLVRTLERITEDLEKGGGGGCAFLCLVRLEEEGLTLYPIEYYAEWRDGE